ncbi:oligosaccharide biosynthesis protein Alg14-like protein, partial [Kalaharituber pfeilii]
LRLLAITPSINPARPLRKSPGAKCHILVVLGSGGHTAEVLRLLSSLNLRKFTHRTYVISSGDAFSAQKAVDFEKAHAHNDEDATNRFTIREVPRARKVGQSWLTTPLSCLSCLWGCFGVVQGGCWGIPDVVVCNGPGSAAIVVGTCFSYKFLGIYNTRTIYVESFARVSSLSLSGKLLYPFVDRFIVQWPGLREKFPRAEYHGVLV